MIEISYPNVMNSLNKGINMRLVCPTQCEADRLFRRACDLWLIKGFTTVSKHSRAIVYGPDKLLIQCIAMSSTRRDNMKGFRGIFLLHPTFSEDSHKFSINEMVHEMGYHNERYLDEWRV